MSKCENLVSQYFMYNKTFQEIEEQAVADYLNCENEVEKNRIFKENCRVSC